MTHQGVVLLILGYILILILGLVVAPWWVELAP